MTVLAWPLTLAACLFMYPWAKYLLQRAEGSALLPTSYRLLLTLTTLALSLGMLTLILMWIGILGLPIDWRAAALLCLVIGAAGWFLPARAITFQPDRQPTPPQPLRNLTLVAYFVVVVIAALVLFNAAYWPFSIDDAVTIYASYGKQIATTGRLPVGNLYETYPMFIPLAYMFVQQASGWANEYLAALIPAMLSVGVIGAAYLLGAEVLNRAAGLIAALLIALAPMYTHWASSGYVDLPCGFFFGMTAVFIARHDRTRTWPDALFVGLMAGLAAWTKNSGILVVLSIGLWVFYRLWMSRYSGEKLALKGGHVLLMAIGFIIVAAPWYTRNLTMAEVLVPPTGWTWKAGHSIANVFEYIRDERYSFVGWLFTAGLVLTAWRLLQSRLRDSASALLAIFYVPFFVIWWALFSYDGRFLLAVIVPVSVMAAGVVLEVFRRTAPIERFMWLRYAAILLAILAIPAANAAVDNKLELVKNPLMSDIDKHRVRLGTDRYNLDLFLRTLPAGTRVRTIDILLPYNADNIVPTIDWVPQSPADLAGQDYWVISPGETVPAWSAAATPVFAEGAYRLYAVSDN